MFCYKGFTVNHTVNKAYVRCNLSYFCFESVLELVNADTQYSHFMSWSSKKVLTALKIASPVVLPSNLRICRFHIGIG